MSNAEDIHIKDLFEFFQRYKFHQDSSDRIDRRARVRGYRLIRESDAEVGYEASSKRIFD